MINILGDSSDEAEKLIAHHQQLAERAESFLKQDGIVAMPIIGELPTIRNGTLIRFIREEPAPEINVQKGVTFPVCYDGKYIRGGRLTGPSWSPKSLVEEFRQGWWEIAGQLDEWLIDAKS